MIEYKGFGLRIDRAENKGPADSNLESTNWPLNRKSLK